VGDRQTTVSTEQQLLEASLEELEFEAVLSHIAKYAITHMGAAALNALRPSLDTATITTELQGVQEMVDIIAAGEQLPFERLDDIRSYVQRSKIEGNFLSATQLLNIAEAVQGSRNIRRFVLDRAALSPCLWSIAEHLIDSRMLEKHITDAIDDTGIVRDNASRELQTIRREMAETANRLRTQLTRLLKKLDEEALLQDDFITQREGRYVVPLRVENKRSIPGIIHGLSQSGSTVFLEPAETIDLNNELSILRNRELREIQRILTTLTAEVGSLAWAIEQSFDILVHIDTLQARARYAMEYGGICPTVYADAVIEFERVHHPILVHQARRERGTVVPLGVRFDATDRGVLISGPNAGGKTVAMKTIGLSVAMAQSGIFPLGTCRLSPRRLFTAIGDHQSIDSNLSTFSSQIIRLRDILSYCGSDALVLVDEICAGTDPAEGGALAAGILDSLVERASCFVVTTHQSSLKQHAINKPNIVNASLAFDEVRMKPTFTFLPNVPGNSYAFVLARNVGLPSVVLDRASEYLGDRHGELEKSIAAIQKFRIEAEHSAREAAEAQAKVQALRSEYEEKARDIRKRKTDVVAEARAEASEILRKAQALIENTIREIREQQKSTAEVKRTFEGERKHIVESPEPAEVQSAPKGQSLPLTIGMTVEVVGTQNIGEVLEVDASTASAMVEVNGIRFRFPMDRLQPTVRKAQRQRYDGGYMRFDTRTSCDVRGKRADEALRDVELFLSDALLGNLLSATIVHGKGTGALRKVLHEYLRDNPQYGTFRNGTLDEGGEGVTIVEFR